MFLIFRTSDYLTQDALFLTQSNSFVYQDLEDNFDSKISKDAYKRNFRACVHVRSFFYDIVFNFLFLQKSKVQVNSSEYPYFCVSPLFIAKQNVAND